MKTCNKMVLIALIVLLSTILFACTQVSSTDTKNDYTEYTITFNSNDGTSVLPIKARQKVDITPPVAPTKIGYTFLGWYKDNGTFNNVFAFTTMPSENVTLYAKWAENLSAATEYTITFESNGGTNITALTLAQDSVLPTLSPPSKEGFIFGGWFTDNGSFKNVFSGEIMPPSNITLYAKWTAVQVEDTPSYGALQEVWEQKLPLFSEVWQARSSFIDSLSYNSLTINSSTVYTLSTTSTTLAYESTNRQTQLENSQWTYSKVTGTNIYASDHLSIYDFFISDVIKSTNGDTYYNKSGTKLIRYAGTDTQITIADSVTTIGSYAFYSFADITSVVLADGTKFIGERAFADCRALISVNNFGVVESIGQAAFNSCSSLITVAISPTLTTIGRWAFANCSSLTLSSVGDGTNSIGEEAFMNCSALTIVNIPQSVTFIGQKAFFGCSALTAVNVAENNEHYKSIEGDLYSKDGKTFIQYAIGKEQTTFNNFNDATKIESYAFYGSKSLTTVIINNGITVIGSSAFSNCRSLTGVTVADSVFVIGSSAFSNCSALAEITIPSGITSISAYAFYGCSALTTITIPVTVNKIDISAFYGCVGLTAVNYGGNSAQWEQMTILRNNDRLTKATVIYP